nr:hypothetical protein CFP56_37779 [Quercus suber]POF24230.1 hypothetical protein CFP56_12645 [Quercus suber]
MDLLEGLWKNLTLDEGEESGVACPKDSLTPRILLAAKFLTRRTVNIESVARTFKPLWRTQQEFRIQDMGENRLFFEFDNEYDLERVLEHEPWTKGTLRKEDQQYGDWLRAENEFLARRTSISVPGSRQNYTGPNQKPHKERDANDGRKKSSKSVELTPVVTAPEKSVPVRKVSLKESINDNELRPEFEETLRKIDEEIGVTSVMDAAVSKSVKGRESFESQTVWESTPLSDVAQQGITEEKAHLIKPTILAAPAGSPKKEKQNGIKPKEQGTWVRYTRLTKADGKVPEAYPPEFDGVVTWIRLDRGVATASWSQKFPTVRVHHISGSLSDHCPLWICSDDENVRFYKRDRPFRFEVMWMKDAQCEGVIKDAWEERH